MGVFIRCCWIFIDIMRHQKRVLINWFHPPMSNSEMLLPTIPWQTWQALVDFKSQPVTYKCRSVMNFRGLHCFLLSVAFLVENKGLFDCQQPEENLLNLDCGNLTACSDGLFWWLNHDTSRGKVHSRAIYDSGKKRRVLSKRSQDSPPGS